MNRPSSQQTFLCPLKKSTGVINNLNKGCIPLCYAATVNAGAPIHSCAFPAVTSENDLLTKVDHGLQSKEKCYIYLVPVF